MSTRRNPRRRKQPRISKSEQRQIEQLREEPDPEDGIDPRVLFKHHYRTENPDPTDHRRTAQLCAQARRALTLALLDLGDPLLRELDVVDVSPAPDASRLRVTVRPCVADIVDERDAAEILAGLAAARGVLRAAVAQAVRRRRAPDLAFELTSHRGGER